MLDINGKKKTTLLEGVNSLRAPSGFKLRHSIVKDGLVVPRVDEVKLGEYCAHLISNNTEHGGFLALTRTSIIAMNRWLYLADTRFEGYQTHSFKNPITFGDPAKLEVFLTELFHVTKKGAAEYDKNFAVAIHILRAIQEKYRNNVKGWRISFAFENPFSYEAIIKLIKDNTLQFEIKAPLRSYIDSLGFRHFEHELDEHREYLGWAEDAFNTLITEHRSIFDDQFEFNGKEYIVDVSKWQLFEVDEECISELVMLRLVYNEWLSAVLDKHSPQINSSDSIWTNSVVLSKMDAYTRGISKYPFSSALKLCSMGSVIEVGHEFKSVDIARFNNFKNFYN